VSSRVNPAQPERAPDERDAGHPPAASSFFSRHGALLLILVVAGTLRLLYVQAPLLDAHRWRQVDTAFIARAFHERTINPFLPEAVWGGAHGYVESEFPLLPAVVAAIWKVTGPTETVGRLVVAAFSVLAVGLIYWLASLLLGRSAALAAAALLAVSPSAVFYGRAFMPDTLMVCFSLAALIGFLRYTASGSRRALVLGASGLALTILVKLPGIIVLAPIAWIAWSYRRWRALLDPALVTAILVPVGLGLAWYAYAYSIYLDTGLTFGIVGTTKTYPIAVSPGPWPTAFSKWSSIELLTSARFYETIVTRLYFLHLTPPGFALALLGLLMTRRTPSIRVIDAWLLSVLAFVFGAGEGHMGHDYYQLPLVPVGAIYFGAAAWPVFDRDWIAARVRPGWSGRVLSAAALLTVALLAFWQSGVVDRHFRPDTLDSRLWRAGQEIDAATDNAGLAIVVDDYGVNSPMLLYFSHLRGWSLDAATATAHTVVGLQSTQKARYFATTRLAEVRRRQPDLASYLDTRRRVPLNGVPPTTALFDLAAER
jgi:4-amino-4-deoxy-L-arabinose transferase-like glycosyltransferase